MIRHHPHTIIMESCALAEGMISSNETLRCDSGIRIPDPGPRSGGRISLTVVFTIAR